MAKASKQEKETAKAKAIANGFDPVAADKVFKMKSPEVAYMAKVAGTPSMQMGYGDRVMKLEHEDKDKKDLVSGNNITMDSGGTSLTTNVQGAKTSNSETVKKSSGSAEFNKAYAEAKAKGGQGSTFTFKGREIVVKDAPSSKSSSSSSSKPNVSTEKKTNISIDNIATPKLSEMEANMAKIRHNNLVGEIRGVSDSIITDKYYRDLATLGRLSDKVKVDALNKASNNNFSGDLEPGRFKPSPGSSKSNLGPFVDNEKFFDFVSGAAADKGRASVGSDKRRQNISRYVVGKEGYNKGAIISRDLYRDMNPGGPSTKNVTGFTYQDILKKSGEKTMQMASTYFDRKRSKK